MRRTKRTRRPRHQLLADFLGHLANERRLSRNTILNYERDVAALLELAGGDAARQNCRCTICAASSRNCTRAASTARSLARMLSAWRGFYRYLARDHGYSQQPVRRAARAQGQEIPAAGAVARRGGAPDGNPGDDRARDARQGDLRTFLFFGAAAARSSPASRRRDINFSDATVRVTGKGAKTRVVPVGSQALAALKKWLASAHCSSRQAPKRCS